MSRDKLAEAQERIADAADAATDEDAIERLTKQAEEFEEHATGDHGPDHGRLARHERILAEIADTEGGAVAENVEAALEAIHAYRETLEGV
jgi:hypothetical protein